MSQGELFLALVHSTKAYAKLVSVDPSAALAMPGVVDYISHQDVPGSNSWTVLGKEVRPEQEEIFATKEVGNYRCVCLFLCFLRLSPSFVWLPVLSTPLSLSPPPPLPHPFTCLSFCLSICLPAYQTVCALVCLRARAL